MRISTILKKHRLMAKLEDSKLAMLYVLAIIYYLWSLQVGLLLLPKKYSRIEPNPSRLWALL